MFPLLHGLICRRIWFSGLGMLLCAFRGERNGQVAGYSKRLCLIEEYLVWLPCLALSATRAAALNPSVLLCMRAVLAFSWSHASTVPRMDLESQGSALWRVVIRLNAGWLSDTTSAARYGIRWTRPASSTR